MMTMKSTTRLCKSLRACSRLSKMRSWSRKPVAIIRMIRGLARNLRRRSLPKLAGRVSPNPNMLSQNKNAKGQIRQFVRNLPQAVAT